MATITVRDLDEDVKARLRVRAAEHGRSMEAEVRTILEDAVRPAGPSTNLARRVHEAFALVGGAEDLFSHIPPRDEYPRPVTFEP